MILPMSNLPHSQPSKTGFAFVMAGFVVVVVEVVVVVVVIGLGIVGFGLFAAKSNGGGGVVGGALLQDNLQTNPPASKTLLVTN